MHKKGTTYYEAVLNNINRWYVVPFFVRNFVCWYKKRNKLLLTCCK